MAETRPNVTDKIDGTGDRPTSMDVKDDAR